MMLLIHSPLIPASISGGSSELRSPPVVHMTRDRIPWHTSRSRTLRYPGIENRWNISGETTGPAFDAIGSYSEA